MTFGDKTKARMTELPFILFSGMAADESILQPQRLAFPNVVIPPWPRPMARESLAGYCERLAEDLRPLGAEAIGGVSFGGIIALEVAKILKPRCVILIASVRSPSALPWRLRAMRPFLPLLPLLPISWIQWLAAAIPLWSDVYAGVIRQFRQADPQTLRWSIEQVFKWKSAPELDCPIFQIHGNRDFVFPISLARPDEIIQGGGHLISLTRGKQVNAFVRSCLERWAASATVPN